MVLIVCSVHYCPLINQRGERLTCTGERGFNRICQQCSTQGPKGRTNILAVLKSN